MNSLLEQALTASKAGMFRQWHNDLSIEERQRLDTQIRQALEGVAPVGELRLSCQQAGAALVDGIATGFEAGYK